MTSLARPPPPEGKNIDGRPVWEPPVFCYSAFIDEEYEKQREAVLAHYAGDVSKTSHYMDLLTECLVMQQYDFWMHDNWIDAMENGEENNSKARFFQRFREEVGRDAFEDWQAFGKLGLFLQRDGEGEWRMMRRNKETRVFEPANHDEEAGQPCHDEQSKSTSCSAQQTIPPTAKPVDQVSCTAVETRPLTPQSQTDQGANEATPLLPQNDTAPTEKAESLLSAFVCGCTCS